MFVTLKLTFAVTETALPTKTTLDMNSPTYPAAAGFPLFYYMIEDLNTIQALYLSFCFLGLVSLLVSLTVLTGRMYLGL